MSDKIFGGQCVITLSRSEKSEVSSLDERLKYCRVVASGTVNLRVAPSSYTAFEVLHRNDLDPDN